MANQQPGGDGRQMDTERQQQQAAGGRKEHPMEKGKKGHGQGGQSGKIQNGQNMQKRDGRH